MSVNVCNTVNGLPDDKLPVEVLVLVLDVLFTRVMQVLASLNGTIVLPPLQMSVAG